MEFLIWVLKLLFLHSMVVVFLVPVGQSSSKESAVCNEADRVALMGFKARIFKDTTGILASWMGRDCCVGDWEGVNCNPVTGRVTGLVLQGPERDSALYMKGTLSLTLGNLDFLEVLVISGMRHITGSIPESFSKLAHLTQLVLEDNSLVGHIPPGLGHLSRLNTLALSGNHLTGHIHRSLGNLGKLQHLGLARNSLSGPVPPAFKSLLSLEVLDLSHNLLSGLVPEFMNQFQNLSFIDLSNNQLSGEIPSSICSVAKLADLSLDNNKLKGKIPTQIGNLKFLRRLSLSSNWLSGQIPTSLGRLESLWYLNLSNNALSNPPPVFANRTLPSLLSIDLSYNNLSLDTIPSWIKDKELSEVHLAGCKIKGSLPRFTKSGSLVSIDLSDNFLTDGIFSFLTISSLQKLKLANNQFSFDLKEIRLTHWISSVELQSNQHAGALSSILNNRTGRYLEVLDVSGNQISGTLPEFTKGLGLKVLNLGSNKIAGQIPPSISNLNELQRLDVSRNHLSGNIPTSLGQLTNLQWLDLSINSFTGRIPTSLLSIKNLKHVSFRANRLCGEIPQRRPYNIFPPVAYAHNLCLCGKPLSQCRTKQITSGE